MLSKIVHFHILSHRGALVIVVNLRRRSLPSWERGAASPTCKCWAFIIHHVTRIRIIKLHKKQLLIRIGNYPRRQRRLCHRWAVQF